MKKILHVISGMNSGGMENMIMNYYRNIDRSKFQFDFLINEPDEVFFEKEILKLGGHIYRVPFQRQNIFMNHKRVREVLQGKKYDVIHMHQGITYYYPLKYAKQIGVKNRVIHNHGINRNFLKYLKIYNNLFARKRISSLGNNYLSCSKEVLAHIYTDQIIKKENYTILPNSIDVEKFCYNENSRKKIRKEFNIKEKEKVFVHIGTFTIPKNHLFLINVFSRYLKKEPNSKLILVGTGELEEKIKNKIKDLNLEQNVIFVGVRNDVFDILSASDIMLFPSLYEGLPLVLVEAQANGINIVSSNNVSRETQITELIQYVEIDSEEKWIKAIKKISKTKAEKRKSYNKRILDTEFSIKKSVKKLEQIYNKY